jgi:hypothetical protein
MSVTLDFTIYIYKIKKKIFYFQIQASTNYHIEFDEVYDRGVNPAGYN